MPTARCRAGRRLGSDHGVTDVWLACRTNSVSGPQSADGGSLALTFGTLLSSQGAGVTSSRSLGNLGTTSLSYPGLRSLSTEALPPRTTNRPPDERRRYREARCRSIAGEHPGPAASASVPPGT